MTERFSYSGPATIDGVAFSEVELYENPREGGLRSWAGNTSIHAASAPPEFSGNIGQSGPVEVALPDGRTGQVLVTNAHFDGTRWTLELLGTGRAPRPDETE